MPLPTSRDVWPQCSTVKIYFWAMVDGMPIDRIDPFESVDEDEHHVY